MCVQSVLSALFAAFISTIEAALTQIIGQQNTEFGLLNLLLSFLASSPPTFPLFFSFCFLLDFIFLIDNCCIPRFFYNFFQFSVVLLTEEFWDQKCWTHAKRVFSSTVGNFGRKISKKFQNVLYSILIILTMLLFEFSKTMFRRNVIVQIM